MELLIGGTWQSAASGRTEEVTSPFDGAVISTVPVAEAGDVRAALDRAELGAVTWRRTPPRWLRTRSTVASLTPAWRAISRMG